ncbi:Lrp/AsnC family transcriptional regulator [Microbacterium sp. 18062]|uniref:Lrp/AsnC family transcriptional regulator n=1 Tax=Microbacterium sp. 18062 TaxID=2681410 RepID=UPI00135A3FE3|nr:AsnC family transcriptional regulator [Microbacterium sp. 18062]
MSASRARDALLSALAEDGRASVEALGRATGLSGAHTRQLLAQLADENIEVRGIVHPSVFGQHAFAHLLLASHGSPAALADALGRRPEIPYVTRVAGELPVAAEVRVADRPALAELLDTIRRLPEVRRVEVDEYLDIVKDAMVALHPLADVAVDGIDRVLLRRLQADGRESYASLARAVGLTTAAARARVLRLIDSGVVQIGIRQQARQDSLQIGFRLTAKGIVETRTALSRRPAIEYLATTIGRSGFVGTIRVPSLEEAETELDAMHSLDGVTELASWAHLAVTKELYDPQEIPLDAGERTH